MNHSKTQKRRIAKLIAESEAKFWKYMATYSYKQGHTVKSARSFRYE